MAWSYVDYPARFWAKVGIGRPEDCWPWLGYCEETGYGRAGKSDRAHRIAFMLGCGPIPEGGYICHRCDNPPCCNPAHLFLGDAKANAQDMAAKGRTGGGHPKGSYPEQLRGKSRMAKAREAGTCVNGHPVSESYRRKSGPRAGEIVECRICKNERRRAARRSAKAVA